MSRKKKVKPLDAEETALLRQAAFLSAFALTQKIATIDSLLHQAYKIAKTAEQIDPSLKSLADAIWEVLSKSPNQEIRLCDALGFNIEDLDYIDGLRYDRLRAREKGEHWDEQDAYPVEHPADILKRLGGLSGTRVPK